MKRVVVALALVGLAAVGALFALVATLDAETLGREAIRRVNEIEGVTLEADEAILRPLSGLELSDVRGSIRLESGDLEVSIRSLRLKHRLLPLLARRLSVSSIHLDEPTLELISRSLQDTSNDRRRSGDRRERPPKAVSEPVATEGAAVDLEISALHIRNGRVVLRRAGVEAPDTEVRGFDLSLSDLEFDPAAGYQGLSGSGEFAAAEIRAGDTEARDAEGRWVMENGRVEMTGVGFDTTSAQLEMRDLKADLSLDPFSYSIEIDGDLDLNTFVVATGDRLLGPAFLTLAASGYGPETAQFEGAGTVDLESGRIPAPAFIEQIERLVGRKILSGRPYEATQIRFSIVDDTINVQPFDLVSEEVELGTDGRIGLDGALDLALRLRAPRDQVDLGSAAEPVLDALTDEAGWLELPFRVTGSFEAPSVVPAWDDLGESAVDAAIGAAKKKLEEEGLGSAVRFLDRLVGRKDGDGE